MHFLHDLSDALVRFGPVGVLLLAILDSFGVPLPAVMDALIIYVAWKSPGRAWFTAGMALGGSVVGNYALFLAARHGFRRFLKPPEPGEPQKFRHWFHRYGLVTVFIPAVVPVLPLPLKVFVISAGMLHTPSSHFLAVILVARFIRYFSEAYLGMKLGEGAQAFLGHHAWQLAGLGLAVAMLLIWFLERINRRRDGASS